MSAMSYAGAVNVNRPDILLEARRTNHDTVRKYGKTFTRLKTFKRVAYLDDCSSQTRQTRIDGLRARGLDVCLAPAMAGWDQRLMHSYLPLQLESYDIQVVVCSDTIAAACINDAYMFEGREILALYPRVTYMNQMLPHVKGKVVLPRHVNQLYDVMLRESLTWNGLEDNMPFVYYDFEVPMTDEQFVSVVADTMLFM